MYIFLKAVQSSLSILSQFNMDDFSHSSIPISEDFVNGCQHQITAPTGGQILFFIC